MADDVTEGMPELDIGSLLAMTFEAKPSNDMAERVGSRVALTKTLSEFARLLVVSPWHWVRGDDDSLVTEDE
ncbi:MAG: hypothetical protein AAGF11_01545 [Myxococcota bacterium]